MAGLINRERELERLEELWRKTGPALGLLYGRRRVGKTYLLQHFLRRHHGIYFLCAESSSRENLEELLDQVRSAFPARQDATLQNYPGWRPALRLLCDLAVEKSLLVVFDEFSYLCHVETAIPSLIQAVWDKEAKGTLLKLILCGSEIGMLAALDEYGRPLHGRFDWAERYTPLDYYDSARFLIAGSPPGAGYGARDLLRAYGLFGGGGRYLDAIDPTQPLSKNAFRLLLAPSGMLHREGENLIRQERDIRDYSSYNAILGAIASGATELGEITNQSHVDKPTVLRCLERLQQLRWVEHEKPFEEPDRRGVYRLRDNLLKSWYRFVFKNRSALQMAPPEAAWAELLAPGLDDYMGSQIFEAVCAQHLARFASAYSLPLVMEMGRWWSRNSEVELDLVARLSDDSYLFGECKWAVSAVDADELGRLKHKVQRVPHGRWQAAPRYVLFSAGGFTQRLIELAEEQGAMLVGPGDLFRGLPVPA
ncbi:MAG: ATP-binding protein [Chloroflexi bacterium]|nr:ATP-binding protein [Chloroflexota bacterium]